MRLKTHTCKPASTAAGNWFTQRDPRAFLRDIQQDCVNVENFLPGIGLADYLANLLLRSAVERQLQNSGEALSPLARTDPDSADQVPEYRQLIGFGNVLVHGYASLNLHEVWRAIAENLPPFRQALDRLIADPHSFLQP